MPVQESTWDRVARETLDLLYADTRLAKEQCDTAVQVIERALHPQTAEEEEWTDAYIDALYDMGDSRRPLCPSIVTLAVRWASERRPDALLDLDLGFLLEFVDRMACEVTLDAAKSLLVSRSNLARSWAARRLVTPGFYPQEAVTDLLLKTVHDPDCLKAAKKQARWALKKRLGVIKSHRLLARHKQTAPEV